MNNEMKSQGSIGKAVLGGVLAAAGATVVWAVVTVITGYQVGIIAIAVGWIIGKGVWRFGKGSKPVYGIIGALISFVSVLIGNLIIIVVLSAQSEGIAVLELVRMINYGSVLPTLFSNTQIMDIVFYGIATYEGYRFAFVPSLEYNEVGYVNDNDNVEQQPVGDIGNNQNL